MKKLEKVKQKKHKKKDREIKRRKTMRVNTNQK